MAKVFPSVGQKSLRRARNAIFRGVAPADWGNLYRLTPFSDAYGLDRGESMDRPYIDSFIDSHSSDIRGAVLEVRDDRYTKRYGGERVESSTILDIDPSNPDANLIADLGAAGSLPKEAFDCLILTQTLQLVRELPVALMNSWSSLRPGGCLLLSMPSICRLDPTWGPEGDYWRYTSAGMRHLLETALNPAEMEIEAFGNLLVSVAFLFGLSYGEIDPADHQISDPSFPIVVCARASKP